MSDMEHTAGPPARRAYSREEMIDEARAHMRETFGPCRESANQDAWHGRLGLLVDFVHSRFPAAAALAESARVLGEGK